MNQSLSPQAFLPTLKAHLTSLQSPAQPPYQIISAFLNDHKAKSPNSNDQEPEPEQDSFSPSRKKANPSQNLSHFSSQNPSAGGSPTRSNYSNFDDNSSRKNKPLFQEFNLQNFIRKRNSEILKNLSRGSLLCPSKPEPKEPDCESTQEQLLATKTGQIQVLNFEDHYALKRVSMNLNCPGKAMVPLIMLHKKSLMKKVMEGAATGQRESQTSDSENNANTDDDNSRCNEENDLSLIEEMKESVVLQVSLLQSSTLNFLEIVNENRKKTWKNLQECVNMANMMDVSDELDIHAMIKRRILGKNIEVCAKEEEIYRKCMLKQLRVLPFYLYGFDMAENLAVKLIKDKPFIQKTAHEDLPQKRPPINEDFYFGQESMVPPEETQTEIQACKITMGTIKTPQNRSIYNAFLRMHQPSSKDIVFFSSFQGKHLHTHKITPSMLKSPDQKFKDSIEIQMKQCAESFVQDVLEDISQSKDFENHIQDRIRDSLLNPKIFIRDLGTKTGTFVKLKSHNPVILDRSLFVMLSGHLGFFVEECRQVSSEASSSQNEKAKVYINELIEEAMDLKPMKEAVLSLVFVKRNEELKLFEEYRRISIAFRQGQARSSNCVRLGKASQLLCHETKPANFLERIRIKYDCYIAFDEAERLWFLVSSNEGKITTSLTNFPPESDSLFLEYPLFNVLHEKSDFSTNADFYNSHKSEEKLIPGLNTIERYMRSESLANLSMKVGLGEDSLEFDDYISKPNCWICVSRFSLLNDRFASKSVELGDGSIVKFGSNQILLRKIRILENTTTK